MKIDKRYNSMNFYRRPIGAIFNVYIIYYVYILICFFRCRFLTTNEAGTSILDHDVIKGDNLHLTVAGLEAWALCAAADIKSGLEDEEHENTRT